MTRVLADTSIWVAHFQQRNEAFVQVLQQEQLLTHPFVLGEVAAGTPPSRTETLDLIAELKQVQLAGLTDTLDFIARERLYGLGCGFIDLALLASTIITPGVALWTLDKRLAKLADRFNVAYRPLRH
jgi:predicted nucleic acid-binding protein